MVELPPSEDMPSHTALAELWANEISKLSDKLSEEDLFPLIVIGSLVYQKGCQEAGLDQKTGAGPTAVSLVRKDKYARTTR